MGFAHVSAQVGLPITLTMLVILALGGSLLQSGVFGLAGCLPPNYMQAVMMGNGLAGLTVILIRVLTKATIESEGSTDQTMLISTAIYFFVSSFVIVICIVSYLILLRTPFVKYYIDKASKPAVNDIVQYDEYNNIQGDEKVSVSVWQVFLKIKLMGFAVFAVFTVTLAIFPGLVVTIPTYYPDSPWASWFPIVSVLFFQLFDSIGRTVPRWFVVLSQRTIVVPVLMRVAFLVLFLLCLKPRYIVHDAFPLVFMAGMAFTNGYFSSLIMMFAPSNVRDNEKQTAGTLMTFFLLLGICAGSNLGLGIGLLIDRS
jgi:equilibrative nucleoside transporter 1/2/3